MPHPDVPKPDLEPVVWHPPANPGLTGPYERNELLSSGELWPVPDEGPEDVVLAEDGTLYAGTLDSSILRITDKGDRVERVARTGGRPLGIELLGDGRLLVCDAHEGLLAVDPESGAVEPLTTELEGQTLLCTNNAAVAPDGTIWFTDSSRRFRVHHHEGDLMEHTGTGRLLRRDPDGTVEVAMDGLQFANGVVLDPDGAFVLVAETGLYRITRLWLSGERAGQSDVFAELPGFPDNLSLGPTGTVWCAVPLPRNPLQDFLANKPPALRRFAWKLPEQLLKVGRPRVAIAVGYDLGGTVTHNLQWHGGEFHFATGVREYDGWLYLGSLTSTAILRYRL